MLVSHCACCWPALVLNLQLSVCKEVSAVLCSCSRLPPETGIPKSEGWDLRFTSVGTQWHYQWAWQTLFPTWWSASKVWRKFGGEEVFRADSVPEGRRRGLCGSLRQDTSPDKAKWEKNWSRPPNESNCWNGKVVTPEGVWRNSKLKPVKGKAKPGEPDFCCCC